MKMQKGHWLQFDCEGCRRAVSFSVFDLESHLDGIECGHCGKRYAFNDETLKKQLTKFEALCRQIHDSEEILSMTSVGVDVGPHKVKIPFKLLLTRLNSCLELEVGGKPVVITFRVEPVKEMKTVHMKEV